ncbi:hypothetical protein ACOME3_006139 [Neoechinorhynchus agilis]
MGSCTSRQKHSDLIDSRIKKLPSKIKPFIIPIWRDQDILELVLELKCPIVVFYSGPRFNNREVERHIRYYQDKYVFSAYRSFESNPPSLIMANESIPCVVLYANWISTNDRRSAVRLEKDNRANIDLLDSMFGLFEAFEFPDWWTVTDEENADYRIPDRNCCLVIETLKPLSFISQMICNQLCSFRGHLHIILIQTQRSFPAETLCRFYENGRKIKEQEPNMDFNRFIDLIKEYMTIKLTPPKSIDSERQRSNRIEIDRNYAFIEVSDKPGDAETFHGIYVTPRGIGVMRDKIRGTFALK